MSNIEVYSFDGLTVSFAKEHNVSVLVRGIRNSLDYEYEKELATINSKLNKNIKTVFLMSKPEHSFISSSAAREIFYNNGNLSEFLPEYVINYLKKL